MVLPPAFHMISSWIGGPARSLRWINRPAGVDRPAGDA
jgi:hypothetical protein